MKIMDRGDSGSSKDEIMVSVGMMLIVFVCGRGHCSFELLVDGNIVRVEA